MNNQEGVVDHIINDLIRRIDNGDFGKPGAATFPSYRQIAEEYGCHRVTANTVTSILQADGVLHKRGRKGLIINPLKNIKVHGLTKNFEAFLKDLGYQTVVKNLVEPEVIQLPDELAKSFRVKHGIHVVHRERVQGIPDVPIRIARNYYPLDLAEAFLDSMKDSHFDVLAAIHQSFGCSIVRTHEEIVPSRRPTKEEQVILAATRDTRVCDVERVCYDQHGQVVMMNLITWVANHVRFEHENDVSHWS